MIQTSIACLLSLLLALAPVSVAYETALQPDSVREAYFLGKHSDQKTIAFLASYTKRLPLEACVTVVREGDILRRIGKGAVEMQHTPRNIDAIVGAHEFD